jgi:hypothetical protein
VRESETEWSGTTQAEGAQRGRERYAVHRQGGGLWLQVWGPKTLPESFSEPRSTLPALPTLITLVGFPEALNGAAPGPSLRAYGFTMAKRSVLYFSFKNEEIKKDGEN